MNIAINIPPPVKLSFETPTKINLVFGVPEQINVTFAGLIPGSGSDSTVLSVQAGEVISGGKAVIIGIDGKAYVYDVQDETHAYDVAGIANHAALLGEDLAVTVWGKAKDVGSGWQKGVPYFIVANGLLSTSPPAQGIVFPFAFGIAADTVLISNNSFQIISI